MVTKKPKLKMSMFDFMTPAEKRRTKAMMRSAERAKEAAHGMALDLTEMIKDHNEELRQNVGAFNRFDNWIEDNFAPFIAMGGDPHELIWAVSRGMTLEEYKARPGPRVPGEIHQRIRQ